MADKRGDIDAGRLAERMEGLPGIARLREAAQGIRSTSSAARCGTCCSGASAPTSTSSSRATSPPWPSGSAASVRRARALRTAKVKLDGPEVDIAARPHGELPAARGPAGGRAGAEIEEDLAPPRLHDQRDGDPAARRAAADRSPRRLGGSRARAAAGPARRLVRRRPDAGAARRPLRGALRLRAGAARPRRCCARPT